MVLGWYITDGCCASHSYDTALKRTKARYVLHWSLRYDSFNILYFLRKIIKSDHLLAFDRLPDGRLLCSLSMYSKQLATVVADLSQCRLGKKAVDINYPMHVLPNDDHSSLIRGIFEGDGCLSYHMRDATWRPEFRVKHA